MNFNTTTEKQKSEKYDGVSFVVRLLTERARTQVFLSVQKEAQAIIEAGASYDAAMDGREPGQQEELKPRDQVVTNNCINSINAARSSIREKWIRAGIESVSGVTIDGVPANLDAILASAPDDLLDELNEAVVKANNIGEEQEKNSESPTTSVEPEVGETNSSTAKPADSKGSTKRETADSISPKT